MVKAIRMHRTGGPEVLAFEDVAVGKPGKGEVRIRQTAVGLNYIDVYFRTGLYPVAKFPFVPGLEAAGVIDAVGPGVSGFKVGQRVAYGTRPPGAYAEARLYPVEGLVKLPREIDDVTAAAMMLKGMTAQYLLRGVFPVKRGDRVLIHAAAGGVGLILCQWAHHLGAFVIGTVGSAAKARLARRHGCDVAIDYTTTDFVARVKALTKGRGVDVVYDSVGQSTFMGSLDCLRPRGMMASYGNASGAVAPISPLELAKRGSLFLTRPSLMDYAANPKELQARARDLFKVVRGGHVKIEVNQTYKLADAAQAHRDLEARKTTGATVLLP